MALDWGILLYYAAVRIIHELLDAGPIVLILTALGAIFTIGLGDDSNNENRFSAYSVFNRGFQQMMGSVDAENLLQQHVGGAGAAAAFMGVNNNNNQAVGLQPTDQRPNENHDDTNNDEMQDAGANNDDNDNNPANNRARKSGKKTRRRNFEQRQELQQQRRAAQEFVGDDLALQQVLQEQLRME
eukprot:CAMPEP_0194217152 /NCGR_PEP_ID=MMETSP0156-20130528/20463_1 /TAXON_ID=33649 /ORGANISM="Thalassionema nitzschioides, Strain L26-B" /LENGTH=184 /DNA_ID=CAMNT_0038946111 /DNA_START=324 /DNA_END=879 /DNA_ORIENTATION=-